MSHAHRAQLREKPDQRYYAEGMMLEFEFLRWMVHRVGCPFCSKVYNR
jgi:hypothetical protein